MYFRFAVLFFSMISMLTLAGCSDDENPQYEPELPPEPIDLKLTFTEGETTSSTYSFSVHPSDPEVAYLCLYASQSVFEGISKDKLVDFLMSDLKKQADAKEQSFEEFITSISIKGDYETKLENLVPGDIYEIVAFAISGVTPGKRIESLFFQTLYVDLKECEFKGELIPNEEEGKWGIAITPSVDDIPYYTVAVDKGSYDNYIQQYSKEELLSAFFVADVQMLQEEGYDLATILDALVRPGYRTMNFRDALPVGMEIVWMAGGLEVMASGNVVLTTEVATGDLTIPEWQAPQAMAGARFGMDAPFGGLEVKRSVPMIHSVK